MSGVPTRGPVASLSGLTMSTLTQINSSPRAPLEPDAPGTPNEVSTIDTRLDVVAAQPTGNRCHLWIRLRSPVRGRQHRSETQAASTTSRSFLLCALLPWNFFVMVQNTAMGSIIANAGLVGKVAFPREVLPLAQVGHGIVRRYRDGPARCRPGVLRRTAFLAWLPVTIVLMLLLAAFSAGLGLALSAIGVYFRDLPYLWGIVLQVWFFATPIVYPPSLLESELPSWAYDCAVVQPDVPIRRGVQVHSVRWHRARGGHDGRPRCCVFPHTCGRLEDLRSTRPPVRRRNSDIVARPWCSGRQALLLGLAERSDPRQAGEEPFGGSFRISGI